MNGDRLQRQRFELKYHVSPATVPALREFLRCHLEPDPFSAARADLAYPVHSIYLDSPNLSLRQATINGDRNRCKVRLRYYSAAPTDPVFCEIKSRLNDCIRKQRAAVRRECLPALFGGAWPELAHLHAPHERGRSDLRAFLELVGDYHAAPCALVTYRREAWSAPLHNAVRVTFDYEVRCAHWTDLNLPPGRIAGTRVFGDDVILEIKFTDRFPRWVAEFVHAFNLVRASAAKYVDGLAAVDAGVGDRFAFTF